MYIKSHFKITGYTDTAEKKNEFRNTWMFMNSKSQPLYYGALFGFSSIIQFQERYITATSVLTLKHLQLEECT